MNYQFSIRSGIRLIPFLLSLTMVSGQARLLHHIPPPHGIIGEALTLTASSLEITDPLEATLYYRLPGSESYLEVQFIKTGFNWEATIPRFSLTEAGLEYVITFQFSRDRLNSFPEQDPFNEPHYLSAIPPKNQPTIGVFGDLPAADVLILSPDPGALVDQNSILIAASFFSANKVEPSSVQLFLDGVDVSSVMIFEDGILSYDPGSLPNGMHSIEIKMQDYDGEYIEPVNWSFTVGTERKSLSDIVRYNGRLNSRLSAENVSGTSLNIAEVMGNFNVDVQWANLKTDLRLTSRESPHTQPHNRFGASFAMGDILDIHLGDHYPRFSPFTIDGKRVRGMGLDANLKWVRLQYVSGDLNRAVHERGGVGGGYQLIHGLTSTNLNGSKTYYLDRTGFMFKRKVRGFKLSTELFSRIKASVNLMSVRDDTSSVNRTLNNAIFPSDSLVLGVTPGNYNYDEFNTLITAAGHKLDAPKSHWAGQKPQDNIVFGFNIGTIFDNRKLTLDFDWNMSLHNRDIWDGVMSIADLDTALDDSLDGYIGLQYDEDGNEITGVTKISTDQIFIDPERLKDLFIINTNMSPLVPIDLNAYESSPISSIINMPSSAFNIKLRGNYSRNSILVEYRQIGPEYVSLANPFLRNNTRQFTISDRVTLLDRKMFLNIGFKHLDNKILRTTVTPLNTNTFFMNLTFLMGPDMPTFVVNYQSIGKNNEKTRLDSVGSQTVDLREDSKAATSMMAVTMPFTSGDIKQNLTINMGSVANLDNLKNKRSATYLFPKTDSKTSSISLSSTFPSQLKTVALISQTKLQIPSMSGGTLIKTPYTWTHVSLSANQKFLQDKMLARGTISLLNSKSQIKSQLLGFRAGADYRIQENLSASIMGQIRFNYVSSYKKDKVDNDGDGKIDNAGEVLDLNSSGIILTLQYNF